MKRFFYVLLLVTALLVGFSSCSISHYPTSAAYRTDTQVILSENNFKVMGQTEGQATVTRVFFIGGLSARAVRENAYAAMIENANLKGAQTVINVTYSVKGRGFLPFYWRTEVTAHGTVVEFIDK